VPGLQTSDGQKQPAFRKEAVFRTKNLNRKWPILMCIALSTKKRCTFQMFLAGFYLTIQLLKITRGWEAEGLEEEAKVCFIHFSCFAFSAPPSSTVLGPP
jgi:hypothetical protein